MRTRHAAILAVAALLLGACSSGSSGINPPGSTYGNGSGPITPQASFHAMFQLAQGILPYPNDLYFQGSTDGTLRLPLGLSTLPNAASINGLDGFSTIAPITIDFNASIDAATLGPQDIAVIRVTLDNATKGVSLPPAAGAQMPHALVYGTDYIAYVAGAGPAGAFAKRLDSAGEVLVIQPTHPLDASSGATNIGYIVLLSNGIKDTGGHAAVPDNDYATVSGPALADLAGGATSPTCAPLTNPTLNGVCRLTFGHLAVGGLLQVANPAHVVLSFSFSTQSTADTLGVLSQIYQATPVPAGEFTGPGPGGIGPVPTGLTTTAVLGAASPGYADIWVGLVQLPYYLTPPSVQTPTAPLTAFWTAAGPPAGGLDPTSRKLTRFNPVPQKVADLSVPLVVGVPNASTSCVEPNAGWPVVVFQHGITGNRSQAIAIFDAYTSHCFVVVAIDLPLHGITDTTSPLYVAGHERTFDVDYMNNTTQAPGPDGAIDSSGSHFINLTSLLTSRDNLRQANSDLLWLGHVLPKLSLLANKNGTSDVDGTRIQLAGQSLGSIVSMPVLAMPNSPYKSGLLSVPGGGVPYLLRDSPTFGPVINAGLRAASQGLLVPGASLYDNWLRDAQTVLDAGDPLNYAAAAVANRPILMQQVVGGGLLPDSSASGADTVIPNSATQRLIAASNVSRVQTTTPYQAPLAAGSGAYVNFIFGNHGSLLDPRGTAVTAASNYAAFLEMQTEAVGFALAQGTVVTVADPTVTQP